jgi:HK97 family phage prohead protease
MPLPKPKKNEKHDDFMERCMSDEVMVKEYDDEKQRYAVCQTQWDNSRSHGREIRVINLDDVELRLTDDEKPKIIGYAAKYGKWSVDLGGFKEKIRPGAFDEILASKPDVRALKNHDPNLMLGRTKSGTLMLRSNTVGLQFEIDPPDTNTGRDMVEEIRRKDIDGCSFSFITAEDEWKNNEDESIERTIVKVGELYDVGPVTFPAYPDTTVAARSLDAFKEHIEQEKKDSGQKQEIDRERQKDIERKYRKAGRIINRNRPAEV